MIQYDIEIGVPSRVLSGVQLARYLDTLGELGLSLARDNAPVRTGRLRESIRLTEPRYGEASAEIVIESTLQYAEVVEVGRKKFAPFPGRFYMRKTAEMLGAMAEIYLADFFAEVL